jgi:hypothetical protein
MFSSIRKARILIPFFYERLGDYAELARADLAQFRNETVRSIAGAVVGAAALLLLLSFIGIAVIVTAWDTPHRILTAWLVVLGWSLCTGACVYAARRLMSSSAPFAHVGSAISSDLAVINNPGNSPEPRHSSTATAGERNATRRIPRS